jgi:CHAT domain-containing protein
MTKAESLRQAQLELIGKDRDGELLAQRGVGGIGKLGEVPAGKPDGSVPVSTSPSGRVSTSTSHPYFWAPFVLVGDGK